MKTQITLSRWFTAAAIGAMLLQVAFVSPSTSTQGQEQALIELSDDIPDISALLTGDPTVPWSVQVGSTGTQIFDIGTDTSGNVYVTGTVFSASDQDAFVAKMDINGNILWNYSFEGMTSDVSSGIELDPSGNVFVTGGFRENNATSGTPRDIFLARFSNDGSLLWKTTWGAANRTDGGNELALDEMGNIYITGASNASWGSPIRPHSLGFFDAFAAKFDKDSGALIWNTFLGENLVGSGLGIEADPSGNVYITGYSYVLTQGSNTSQNAFVAGLNTNGGLLWYTALGTTGLPDISLDIALDETENIYVTGESRASWGAPLKPFSGEWDVFVAKLTSSGSLQWNTFVGGNGSDFADGIDVDDTGNIYLTGSSSNTWGSPFSSGTGDPQEVFSAKLESNGTLAWNTFILGTHPSAHGAGHNVIAVQDGSIYVANH